MSAPIGRGDRGNPNDVGAPSPSDKPFKYEPTPEEEQALRSCATEAFYYRCLPLSCLLMGGATLLTKRGVLQPHPQYGPLFYNLGGGITGYIMGKLSYVNECADKIKRLENSPLGEAMRRGRSGTSVMRELQEQYARNNTRQDVPEVAPEQRKKLQDDYRAADFDTSSNVQYKGLDENSQPSVDGRRIRKPDGDQPQQQMTTYQELRNRNRQIYEGGPQTRPEGQSSAPPASVGQATPLPHRDQGPKPESSDAFSPSVGSDDSRPRPRFLYDEANQPPPPRRGRRNQYGDLIEE